MSEMHTGGARKRRTFRLWSAILLVAMGVFWLPVGSARAASAITVGCVGTAGDTAGLISAITQANANAGPDTITLSAGCVYTLGVVDNSTSGPNGLPVIVDTLTIMGNGATIARSTNASAFRIINNSGTLTLDHLTLKGGLISGGNGGAIYNTGTLTLISSTVSDSTARGNGGSSGVGGSGGGFGGGIYNAGSLTVRASTLASNQAVGGNGSSRVHEDSGGGGGGGAGLGGAIYSVASSTITVLNSTISGNGASGGSGGSGGDNGSRYSGAGGGGEGGAGGGQGRIGAGGNFGGGGGGGGGSNGSDGHNDSFAQGTPPAGAGGTGGFGGGGGGAGATRFGGRGNVGGAGGSFGGAGGTSCCSYAAGGGGGAGLGGGIFASGASITIASSTIYANTSVGGAGGVGAYTYGGGSAGSALGGGIFAKGGTISYRNSIILGNGASDCALSGGTLSSLGNNLLSSAGGCTSVPGDVSATTDSAGILPLADNGGPTATHALNPGSPAIDAASSVGIPATDQRGVDRPQGNGYDIGAFEYKPPVVDLTYNVTTNADSGTGSLRQAIIDSNHNAGFDTIHFALPADQLVISPTLALPTITDRVKIDGTSQPGYVDTPLVRISGSGVTAGTASGLSIAADGSSVRGLGITGFSGGGITISGSGNTVESNIIALNKGAGVAVLSGSANRLRQNRIADNTGLGIDLLGDTLITSGPGQGPNNLQPFPLISAATETSTGTQINGTLATQSGSSYTVEFYASLSCDASGNGEGQTFIGAQDLSSPSGGTLNVGLSLDRTDLSGFWITALATDSAGNSSEFSPCAPINTNNLWTNATPLDVQSTTTATISQKITNPSQERWYRFPVTPGSKVRVTLNGLPGSAITLHRDLPKIYQQLSNPQSVAGSTAANLPASYLPASYLPASYLPASYLPASYLPASYLPASYLPASYLPASYLPASYLPASYLPASYLPASYLPASYLPASYLPASYLPASYLPASYLPSLYSGAVIDGLMAIGAEPNVAVQTIERNTWDLNENLYVRVTGPVNLSQSFSLSVTAQGGVCASLSAPPANMLAITTGAPTISGLSSLILWDSQRFASVYPGTDTAALRQSLSTFASRSDIGGTLIDLGDQTAYPRVAYARSQLQLNPACPSAANQVASEIKAVIDAYRGANLTTDGKTTLQYVVLVGGDETIPFFRYPDQAGLGNENGYYPPVLDNSPSNASLRDGRVLGQDGYGAASTIWRGSYELPLPDLAVGRLVGDAKTVTGLLAAYANAGGVVTPHSALVTGYDFVADGATAVRDDLTTGLNPANCASQPGGCVAPTSLIQPVGQGPTGPNAWTATQLGDLLLKQRHDLVFFSGHFDAGNMLAADYATSLPAKDVLTAPTDFTNTILFGLGCHSGYNVPPPDAISGYSPNPDWPEAYAARGATYIAATGYSYGDTQLVEYGERYLLDLAHELRTGSSSVALGSALIRAKQAYLGQKAVISGMDEKTLLQFSLYGLPMLKVDMPGRTPAVTSAAVTGTVAAGGAGAAFGLQVGKDALNSTDITVSSTPAPSTVTLASTTGGSVTATYYTGSSGALATPDEPILPLELRNIGVSGKALRGIGFRGGSYSDLANIIPLTSSPTTENSRGFVSFYSQNFYPTQPWTVTGLSALSGGNSNLAAIVGQYRSDGPSTTSGTLRLFSSMSYRTYYLDGSWAQDTAKRNAGFAPAPQILRVSTERLSPTAVRVRVFVSTDPSVGIQEAWITYTDQAAPGVWQSIDLAPVPGEPGYWTATANLPDTAVFMAQAASATGLVGLDTNGGAFYPVVPPTTTAAMSTSLSATTAPAAGTYGQSVSFAAQLTAQGGTALSGRSLRLSIGAQSAFASTDPSGAATFSLILSQPSGSYTAQISFGGEPGYAPTSLTLPFTIQKDNSALSISPAAPLLITTTTNDSGISAVLTDGGGAPIAERTVLFIGTGTAGSFGQSVKTSPSGQATLGTVSWPPDTYSVQAYFVGSLPLPGGNVTLTDPFYNPSASATATLTIAPLPETIITAGPDSITGDTLTSLSFSGSGGYGTLGFECSLDGAAFAFCVSPVTYRGLADGPHTFRVRAVDALGQVDPTPAERSWTARSIYRARVVNGQVWIERNIALAGLGDYDTLPVDGWSLVGRTNGASDDGTLRSFYVQGGVPYAIAYNFSKTKGNRCFLVTPASLAVVLRGQTRLMTTLVDPAPCPDETPETKITSAPTGTVAATTASFKFTGSGGSGFLRFECSLDGAPFATCVSPKSYSGLAIGDHLFLVRAIDASGTADPTPASAGWKISPSGQMLYRARQDGEHIVIERNIALGGLGDYDGAPVDGWAVVGRTNDREDDGVLSGFYEQGGVPYAIVCNDARNRGHHCILMTPQSLGVVLPGQVRLLVAVRDPIPCPAP